MKYCFGGVWIKAETGKRKRYDSKEVMERTAEEGSEEEVEEDSISVRVHTHK